MCKKDYSWNPSRCICEKSRYLKSIFDDSVIVCNEIISIRNSISTNVTNTVSTNVTNTVSTNVENICLKNVAKTMPTNVTCAGYHITFYSLFAIKI